jgi:hypothetical protein
MSICQDDKNPPRAHPAIALQVIFLSSVTRGFLDRPSPPTILACPQLPHSRPLPWCPNHPPSNSRSNFSPTSIYTNCNEHYSHSPHPLMHACLVNSLALTLGRAMEYLALQARWLPTHALALGPHAQPCPPFSHVIQHAASAQ